jgi:hypothetical protein
VGLVYSSSPLNWLSIQAINQWIDQLDMRLKGKKKRAAARKKKLWSLSPADWEMLEKLCGILEVRLV